MAHYVFGSPITNSTLEGMPEYASKTNKRIDRARVALKTKNAHNKDLITQQCMGTLNANPGSKIDYSIGLVYNATGEAITFVTSYVWDGRLKPVAGPLKVENGQWGVFLHIGAATKSSAAVVYRGKNEPGEECDWMLAWSKPDKAYTEIAEANHFEDEVWAEIKQKLDKSGNYHVATWNGCFSAVKIDGNVIEAVFALEPIT